VKLRCTIALNFNFEFVEIHGNSAINISPLRGVVPALGSTDIKITFKPREEKYIESLYEFSIDQFGFKPILVKV